MNREEYLELCTPEAHRVYYGQFVTDRIKQLVLRSFSKQQLTEAIKTDRHLNNLRLKTWDYMVICLPKETVLALKEKGDSLSLGNGVCILKEAARQITEEP